MMNKFTAIIENLEEKTELCLKNSGLEEDDIRDLSEALRNVQITELDLSNNNIRCSGVIHLADVLKDTQIIKLNLRNTNLLSEGMNYLATLLQGSKVKVLDLLENGITFEAAEHLNELVSYTKVKNLYLDICSAENTNGDICVTQKSYCDLNNVHIELHKRFIGVDGSTYIKKRFCKMDIQDVTFNLWACNKDNALNLADAFKNVNISKLNLLSEHFGSEFFLYLVQIFQESQIGQLNVACTILYQPEVECLATFIRHVKILDLDISSNHLDDISMKMLTAALKNSDIMNLNLSKCSINSETVRHLSDILSDTKLLFIDLCDDDIGVDGARYLANGLRHSQVTSINLHGNNIGYEGYQALINVVDNTNVSQVNLHNNSIEEGMDGERFWPYGIPRNTIPVAYKIENAFKGLVGLNLENDEYEFILPTTENQCYPPMDIDQYAFLIGTLKNNPFSKVHIFKMVNDQCEYAFDFVKMKKIDEFIANITNKFITFFENNLLYLDITFFDVDYINLVRQFEELRLYDIVRSLLFHRVLYYIDENQEILHPYIYKLMHQYSLPIYHSELEPNKRDKIILYYESHQEINGVHEIIDLLRSNSL